MSQNGIQNLAAPARYFPLTKGVYEVAAGLRPLGTQFGNGAADGRVFQIDSDFARYRLNKVESRRERLSKYHATFNYSPQVARAVTRFLLTTFAGEYPELFVYEAMANQASRLKCALTAETLEFDPELNLIGVSSAEPVWPEYVSAFDALVSQIPEDVAVVCTAEGQADWLAAIHLCSPSHWAAEDKIGRDFVAIHNPVAGIDKLNRAAGAMVDAMVNKGPFVRFVWGFATDRRLNHHPEPAPGFPLDEWRGRSFQRSAVGSPFNLRVERQILCGLPEVKSAIFAIRVSFIDGEEIRANAQERALLRSALLSMNPESLVYKGLSESINDVIAWLDEGV